MIKNILFDVGNVLLDFDPERFLKEAGYTKEQQEIAMRCVFTHPLWDQLDKGTVMEKEGIYQSRSCAGSSDPGNRRAHKGNSFPTFLCG